VIPTAMIRLLESSFVESDDVFFGRYFRVAGGTGVSQSQIGQGTEICFFDAKFCQTGRNSDIFGQFFNGVDACDIDFFRFEAADVNTHCDGNVFQAIANGIRIVCDDIR